VTESQSILKMTCYSMLWHVMACYGMLWLVFIS